MVFDSQTIRLLIGQIHLGKSRQRNASRLKAQGLTLESFLSVASASLMAGFDYFFSSLAYLWGLFEPLG